MVYDWWINTRRIRENCAKFWFLSNNRFDGIVQRRNVMQKRVKEFEWNSRYLEYTKIHFPVQPLYLTRVLFMAMWSRRRRWWLQRTVCSTRANWISWQAEVSCELSIVFKKAFLQMTEKYTQWKKKKQETKREGFTWIKCSDFWTFSIFYWIWKFPPNKKKGLNLSVTNGDPIWRYSRETFGLNFIYVQWKRYLIA